MLTKRKPKASSWLQRSGIIYFSLVLCACTTTYYSTKPVTAPTNAGPGSAPPPVKPLRFSDLQGWAEEDHAAAFRAFLTGCQISKDVALYDVCRRARALGTLDEVSARKFFEQNFLPRQIKAQGILTGYFAPEYEAREYPIPPFTAPVRPKPANSPTGKAIPYLDRATIETADPAPAEALAWMRPEDLFFMQIQGSGVLDFPDGHKLKAAFAGSNGQPFVAIAIPLRQRGALSAAGSSALTVHDWLAAHRGPEADAVMRLNPRYVFFTTSPDDDVEPIGAAGLPLMPGRAIAVDPTVHALGSLYWIDATTPVLSGAVSTYRRLAMALDTGGAIKGTARADLYLGRGPLAGVEAGRIRHALTLYELVPIQ